MLQIAQLTSCFGAFGNCCKKYPLFLSSFWICNSKIAFTFIIRQHQCLHGTFASCCWNLCRIRWKIPFAGLEAPRPEWPAKPLFAQVFDSQNGRPTSFFRAHIARNVNRGVKPILNHLALLSALKVTSWSGRLNAWVNNRA